MAVWNEFWGGLSRGARVSLVSGVVVILLAVGMLGWSLMRTEYGVLFSDLRERDMAAMVAELEKQKVAYRVDDQARALLVPKDQVHKVRIRMMGSPVALHGAVGFELFNNSDLAMTDFAQKVNYQRALQGELTRTILSLEEIHDARVHLALPEQGLFRKTAAKAKASVTTHVKPGRHLAPEQVSGIQRLVAASVTDVTMEDVAVLDQHGVVLSRTTAAAGESPALGLDQQQGAEAHLSRKASAVLDKLYGSGESLVTVNAEFGHDQTRITTEEVLPAKSTSADTPAAGVIVRERVSTRETAGAASAERPATSTQETDYQTGKRTEHVVSPAGQLKRLNVAVVVRRPLEAAEIDKVRELVGAAVGLNRQRGDVIAVHSMAAIGSAAPLHATVAASADDEAPPERATPSIDRPIKSSEDKGSGPAIAVLALLLLAAAAAWLYMSRRANAASPRSQRTPTLDDAQRGEVLAQVRAWLDRDVAASRATPAGRSR